MKNSNLLLIERIVREMQLRNYSERTIGSYTSMMSKLGKYFDLPLEKITREQFKDFLHHRIMVDKVSVSVVNQAISAFKIMQQDVLGREWEPLKVKRPRREMKLPVILSVGEVERLIMVTTNLKHRALLALAYSAGLRREETQKIKPGHIDSERMCVQVVDGKGKKSRHTILAQKTLDLLRVYFKAVKPSQFLFETSLEKGKYLSDTTLNKIVKNNAKKAGIKKNVSFHTLRHCFATHLLENGVSLPIIQQLLGHKSVKTTMIYLHVANIQPLDITSPLDSMDI
ncbi:MAG: hypothetical protein B6I19_05715 [Bacteroidetes bacterium 4572_114]|nr:MAG: hypothetical protein B6I19_05715 [Bacteroidetes bacterium 4572_114]